MRPFAGHDAVTVLVLNQVDRLREAEREGVLASLAEIARADGLASAPPRRLRRDRGGVEELREHLLGIARSREAVVEQHRADVRGAAARLREAADPTGMAERSSAAIDTLVEDLSSPPGSNPSPAPSAAPTATGRAASAGRRCAGSARCARIPGPGGIGRGRDRETSSAPPARPGRRGLRTRLRGRAPVRRRRLRRRRRSLARRRPRCGPLRGGGAPGRLDQAIAEADLRAGRPPGGGGCWTCCSGSRC